MPLPLQRLHQPVGAPAIDLAPFVGADADALKALNTRVQGYIDKEQIESTPTFVINGKKLEGEQPLAALDAAIAADPKAAKAYIRKTSMLDALERAEAIA